MAKKAAPRKEKNVVDMRPPERVEETTPQYVSPVYTERVSVPAPTPRRRSKMIQGLVVCALIALGFSFYFYTEWRELQINPQTATEEETRDMVEKVGRLIDLPQDELPVLARITDTTALEDQVFFMNAREGNVVLFYALARKAYLYDPEEDILVEVATLGEGSQI